MKIVTIIGARPQFVKAAPISRELRENHTQILVHTGQHYDYQMSDIFFEELGIPKPDYNLGIGSASHGEQTGRMLIEIEKVLMSEKPDCVIVYGDTNSTLAGALAASKMHIPVVHIEAGLRSFNKAMPEEVNRILTDNVSTILFAPTETAVKNLEDENITENVYNPGDVMYDATLFNLATAEKNSNIIAKLGLTSGEYCLATVHRAENTDNKQNLENIIKAFIKSGKTIVFPVHPRTRNKIKEFELENLLNSTDNLKIIEPIGYFDILVLEKNANKILTDSGGMQKEAYFLKKPCITLRAETEWVETVESGWNKIVNTDIDKITSCLHSYKIPDSYYNFYGDGNAAKKIVEIIANNLVGV